MPKFKVEMNLNNAWENWLVEADSLEDAEDSRYTLLELLESGSDSNLIEIIKVTKVED